MPRKRNRENDNLPLRCRWSHGQIFYQVPKGMEKYWDGKKSYPMGKKVFEAFAEYARRGCSIDNILTIGDLLKRYLVEVTPPKPPQSIKSDLRCYKELIKAFNDVRLEDLTPQHVYQYIDRRSAKVAARREKAMLSHAFTKAVEWGYMNKHPFKGEVRLKGETARTRYVEDWEIDAIMGLRPKKRGDPTQFLQAYITLKLLMPIRKNKLLRLNVNTFTDEGILVDQGKGGKRTLYRWNDDLRTAVQKCKDARPKDICQWLFCNRLGKSYYNEEKGTTSGFDSIWGRFMDRILAETMVREHFTEHDIRAKYASDKEDAEAARKGLGHQNTAITNRAYRRKPEVVK